MESCIISISIFAISHHIFHQFTPGFARLCDTAKIIKISILYWISCHWKFFDVLYLYVLQCIHVIELGLRLLQSS